MSSIQKKGITLQNMELMSIEANPIMELSSNLSSYNSSLTTSLDYITTCSETSSDFVIDHSVHCVGEKLYCNLSKEEYEDLLYDYIFPSLPEWILIISHIIVFLMGLVSEKLSIKL